MGDIWVTIMNHKPRAETPVLSQLGVNGMTLHGQTGRLIMALVESGFNMFSLFIG